VRIFAAILSFTLLFSGVCFGQSRGENKVNFGVELRWINFGFQASRVEVRNIPEFFRQVPVHEKDGHLNLPGQIVTVPSDMIKPGLVAFYSPTLAPEINVGRYTVRGGISMDIALKPHALKGNKDSTREVHQYDSGTSRGSGTSLAFYAIEAENKMKLGWLGEVEYRADDEYSFLAGYAVSKYDMRITNGWDRYNLLEIHSEYKISTSRVDKKYLGFRINSGSRTSVLLLGGIYSEKMTPTSIGKTMNIKYGGSYFISFGFSISVD